MQASHGDASKWEGFRLLTVHFVVCILGANTHLSVV